MRLGWQCHINLEYQVSSKDKGSEEGAKHDTQKGTNERFSLRNLKKIVSSVLGGEKKNQQLFSVPMSNTNRFKLHQESSSLNTEEGKGSNVIYWLWSPPMDLQVPIKDKPVPKELLMPWGRSVH